jgi:glycosyltransferase involved in cell wall biosynthesis
MANDLVSVTLVTYNSGRFIRRCLESVLAQNYPNLEIVVIDNASPTAQRISSIISRTAAKSFYNEENIGFAAAQNQAIGTVERRLGSHR